MKKRRLIIPFILVIIVLAALISGCSYGTGKPDNNGIVVIPLEEYEASRANQNPAEAAENDKSSDDLIPIDVVFINKCGITIGMVSIIEPVSGEQIELAPVDDNNALMTSLFWPKDKTKFQWALYNRNGDLCVESETDMTGITSSAVIRLSGDQNADDVSVTIE